MISSNLSALTFHEAEHSPSGHNPAKAAWRIPFYFSISWHLKKVSLVSIKPGEMKGK